MKIELEAARKWRLKDPPFPFQQTFVTPLPDPSVFVRMLLAPFQLNQASAWIETIVFTPRELIWYLRGLGIIADEGELNGAVLTAENQTEVGALLECLLCQWTDFAFLPSRADFAIYADHDEYTTIFTADLAILEALRKTMETNGVKLVEGWIWTRPRSALVAEGQTNV